eukprot:15335925-Ditylum_brightwellii.AAC.1
MGKHQRRAPSETDLKFQHPPSINQMSVYIDTVHATDARNQRSIGGHVAIMPGAAITSSTKWHQMVSKSSKEAEFIQATSTAQM